MKWKILKIWVSLNDADDDVHDYDWWWVMIMKMIMLMMVGDGDDNDYVDNDDVYNDALGSKSDLKKSKTIVNNIIESIKLSQRGWVLW